MDELKKFGKIIWHLTLSSLMTLFVYFPLSVVLNAAVNDHVDDGSFFWAPFVIYIITELCFLLILWYVRFHNNDELEKAFMKEYHEKQWQGMKADLPQAIKSEFLAYVFVYAVVIICCGWNMMSLGRNPIAVVYFPLTLIMASVHPVIGCIISLAVFTAGYTLINCLVRDKIATVAKQNRTYSVASTKAFISSRRNNR